MSIVLVTIEGNGFVTTVLGLQCLLLQYLVIYPIRLPFVIYDLELVFNEYQDLKYIHLRLDLNILIGIYLTTKHY